MNMILGLNGTGKCIISCALCIGLGFPVVVRSPLLSVHRSLPKSWNEILICILG